MFRRPSCIASNFFTINNFNRYTNGKQVNNASIYFAFRQTLSTSASSSSSSVDTVNRIVTLGDLEYIPGSRKKRIRWGRGTGSGRGKLCGYGHQKAGNVPRGYEGGQTPYWKRLPKVGMHYPVNKKNYEPINVGDIQRFIDMGRLKPTPNGLTTMRQLYEAGLFSRWTDGVKLLGNEKDQIKTPIHLEVVSASRSAIEAVEAVGGTVTTVHFNELALRAHFKPTKFSIFPRRARPPPKSMRYYLDKSNAGYMAPEIIIRNMKLFGSVTSEEKCIEEHNKLMSMRRNIMQTNGIFKVGEFDIVDTNGTIKKLK